MLVEIPGSARSSDGLMTDNTNLANIKIDFIYIWTVAPLEQTSANMTTDRPNDG